MDFQLARTQHMFLLADKQAGGGEGGHTVGEHWLLKQFSLNHPVEHLLKPKLAKLHVDMETSFSFSINHNQFVK